MLKFEVVHDYQPLENKPLRNAYLIGPDYNPTRGEIVFRNGELQCTAREPGAGALVMLHAAGGCGELMLPTCLLPEDDKPYLLSLELVRHRMNLIYSTIEDWFPKIEDWRIMDDPENPVFRRIELARRWFLEALCVCRADRMGADQISTRCLPAAIDASEELAMAYAERCVAARRATPGSVGRWIGCGVPLQQANARVRAGLAANFDFMLLPTLWSTLAPAEGEYRWAHSDDWVKWASQTRVPVLMGPIISFDPRALPPWIHMFAHNYEEIREVMLDHTQHLVTRYRGAVNYWNVASGLHINNHFGFTTDQVMDLTRTCAALVKQLQPSARVIVEITQPFGQYVATTPR